LRCQRNKGIGRVMGKIERCCSWMRFKLLESAPLLMEDFWQRFLRNFGFLSAQKYFLKMTNNLHQILTNKEPSIVHSALLTLKEIIGALSVGQIYLLCDTQGNLADDPNSPMNRLIQPLLRECLHELFS